MVNCVGPPGGLSSEYWQPCWLRISWNSVRPIPWPRCVERGSHGFQRAQLRERKSRWSQGAAAPVVIIWGETAPCVICPLVPFREPLPEDARGVYDDATTVVMFRCTLAETRGRPSSDVRD